jgi:hypothetical protein
MVKRKKVFPKFWKIILGGVKGSHKVFCAKWGVGCGGLLWLRGLVYLPRSNKNAFLLLLFCLLHCHLYGFVCFCSGFLLAFACFCMLFLLHKIQLVVFYAEEEEERKKNLFIFKYLIFQLCQVDGFCSYIDW